MADTTNNLQIRDDIQQLYIFKQLHDRQEKAKQKGSNDSCIPLIKSTGQEGGAQQSNHSIPAMPNNIGNSSNISAHTK